MRSRRSRRGISLVETTIALSGTVMIIGLVSVGTGRAFDTWRSTVSGTEAELSAGLAVDRIVSRLTDAGLTTIADDLSAPAGGSSVTFQARNGFASGAITWGPETTIAWVSDPGDPRDDVDNDGDGLVDEGQIMMTDSDHGSVVLIRNVTEYLERETDDNSDENGNGLIDEQGFSLELDDDLLHIRLTIAKRGANGEMVTRSSESSLRILN